MKIQKITQYLNEGNKKQENDIKETENQKKLREKRDNFTEGLNMDSFERALASSNIPIFSQEKISESTSEKINNGVNEDGNLVNPSSVVFKEKEEDIKLNDLLASKKIENKKIKEILKKTSNDSETEIHKISFKKREENANNKGFNYIEANQKLLLFRDYSESKEDFSFDFKKDFVNSKDIYGWKPGQTLPITGLEGAFDLSDNLGLGKVSNAVKPWLKPDHLEYVRSNIGLTKMMSPNTYIFNFRDDHKIAKIFDAYDKSTNKELLSIETLKSRLNYNTSVGYIYVREFGKKNNGNVRSEDNLRLGGETNQAYRIPFEFNPQISEGSMNANYASEKLLGRIGQYYSYTGTDLSTLNITLEYKALAKDGDYTDQSSTTDKSKQFSTDLWQYFWTNKKLLEIEYKLRSLVLPDTTTASTIIKPPLIEIHLYPEEDIDAKSVSDIGGLFSYPINEKSGYLEVSENTVGFSKYKKYIVNSIQIESDTSNGQISYPTLYDMNADGIIFNENRYPERRGFKATLQCTEITENFLDKVPDRPAYLDMASKYHEAVFNGFGEGGKNVFKKLGIEYLKQSLKNVSAEIDKRSAEISKANNNIKSGIKKANEIAKLMHNCNNPTGGSEETNGILYDYVNRSGYFSFMKGSNEKHNLNINVSFKETEKETEANYEEMKKNMIFSEDNSSPGCLKRIPLKTVLYNAELTKSQAEVIVKYQEEELENIEKNKKIKINSTITPSIINLIARSSTSDGNYRKITEDDLKLSIEGFYRRTKNPDTDPNAIEPLDINKKWLEDPSYYYYKVKDEKGNDVDFFSEDEKNKFLKNLPMYMYLHDNLSSLWYIIENIDESIKYFNKKTKEEIHYIGDIAGTETPTISKLKEAMMSEVNNVNSKHKELKEKLTSDLDFTFNALKALDKIYYTGSEEETNLVSFNDDFKDPSATNEDKSPKTGFFNVQYDYLLDIIEEDIKKISSCLGKSGDTGTGMANKKKKDLGENADKIVVYDIEKDYHKLKVLDEKSYQLFSFKKQVFIKYVKYSESSSKKSTIYDNAALMDFVNGGKEYRKAFERLREHLEGYHTLKEFDFMNNIMVAIDEITNTENTVADKLDWEGRKWIDGQWVTAGSDGKSQIYPGKYVNDIDSNLLEDVLSSEFHKIVGGSSELYESQPIGHTDGIVKYGNGFGTNRNIIRDMNEIKKIEEEEDKNKEEEEEEKSRDEKIKEELKRIVERFIGISTKNIMDFATEEGKRRNADDIKKLLVEKDPDIKSLLNSFETNGIYASENENFNNWLENQFNYTVPASPGDIHKKSRSKDEPSKENPNNEPSLEDFNVIKDTLMLIKLEADVNSSMNMTLFGDYFFEDFLKEVRKIDQVMFSKDIELEIITKALSLLSDPKTNVSTDYYNNNIIYEKTAPKKIFEEIGIGMKHSKDMIDSLSAKGKKQIEEIFNKWFGYIDDNGDIIEGVIEKEYSKTLNKVYKSLEKYSKLFSDIDEDDNGSKNQYNKYIRNAVFINSFVSKLTNPNREELIKRYKELIKEGSSKGFNYGKKPEEETEKKPEDLEERKKIAGDKLKADIDILIDKGYGDKIVENLVIVKDLKLLSKDNMCGKYMYDHVLDGVFEMCEEAKSQEELLGAISDDNYKVRNKGLFENKPENCGSIPFNYYDRSQYMSEMNMLEIEQYEIRKAEDEGKQDQKTKEDKNIT